MSRYLLAFAQLVLAEIAVGLVLGVVFGFVFTAIFS